MMIMITNDDNDDEGGGYVALPRLYTLYPRKIHRRSTESWDVQHWWSQLLRFRVIDTLSWSSRAPPFLIR